MIVYDDKDLTMLSGEPYLQDDVKFLSSPDEYIWQEEMSSWMELHHELEDE